MGLMTAHGVCVPLYFVKEREKPFTRVYSYVLWPAVWQGLRSKSRSDVTRDIKRAPGPQAGAGASRKDES